MDPSELLRIVDTIHRDKNIDKEIVFQGIEAALVSAAKKHYGEEEDIVDHIDRTDGVIAGTHNGVPLAPEEMAERIGAQTAKQVMIQKIREAERDALFDEYEELKGQLVTGVVQRYEGGAATVALANVEAILPRGEQIPGETHHANERVRATVYEVRKAGSRVKVILSRTKPHLVAAALRAGNPRNRRGRDRDPRHRPRARLPHQGRRQQHRPAGRLRGGLRGRARQPHQEHRRRTGRRTDRHRPLERRHAGADPQRLAAGRGRRSHPLPDAGPGDRAGARGPALAGHRPPRAERPPGQQALRLGHRNHDPRGTRRADRAGRGRLLLAGRRGRASWPRSWWARASCPTTTFRSSSPTP